jgi:imidazolonepropionase-like amidohydrolase
VERRVRAVFDSYRIRCASSSVEASNYLAGQDAENLSSERNGLTPRELKLEALGRFPRREIPWRQHCRRADDIATAMRLAQEFGYELVIDHGTEAYLLGARGPTWSCRTGRWPARAPGRRRRDDRHHHRPSRGVTVNPARIIGVADRLAGDLPLRDARLSPD